MPHIYKCVRQKLVSHEHLKVNNYYIVNGMELWHGRHSNSKSVYILFQKPIHIHKSFALPWMVRFLQKKPKARYASSFFCINQGQTSRPHMIFLHSFNFSHNIREKENCTYNFCLSFS